MQASRFSDISMISAIAVLVFGISVVPALASSDCFDNGTVEVCAEWSQNPKPKDGDDLDITFHGANGADVALKTGDPEWRIWTTKVSNGDVMHFGDITLDPTDDDCDFDLQIFGDGEAGAVNVESINLDGTINRATWAGYSSIRAVPDLSWITGSVDGVIKLVEDSADEGGDMGLMLIGGNVGGLITIPTLSGSLTMGNAAGGFVIDLLDGSLTINGTLPSPKIGEIGDMGTGAFSITTVANGATVDLLNGMEGTGGQSKVSTLAGTLDLNSNDMSTGLNLQTVPNTGKVTNGGILSAVFYPSFANGDFAGEATFTSVTTDGQIWAFDVDATPNTNISGDVFVTGHYAGLFRVDGDFTGTLTIDGDLKTSSGDEGLIWIVEDAAGDVLIKGELIGHVHFPKNFTSAGCLTVDGDVTSSGLFKTGDNVSSETHAGDLIFKGAVAGDILIHGNTSGDIDITGVLSGDLTIDEDLSGTGAILVTGLTTGAISIGEETTSSTLIHLLGGLGTDGMTGGSVEINASRGAFNAEGDIAVGLGLAFCSANPPKVAFDGCIHIYDDGDITPDYGDLNGAIVVCGCHATDTDLNICIDGDDNGNVTISQNGCTNQVDWSCGTCPP